MNSVTLVVSLLVVVSLASAGLPKTHRDILHILKHVEDEIQNLKRVICTSCFTQGYCYIGYHIPAVKTLGKGPPIVHKPKVIDWCKNGQYSADPNNCSRYIQLGPYGAWKLSMPCATGSHWSQARCSCAPGVCRRVHKSYALTKH